MHIFPTKFQRQKRMWQNFIEGLEVQEHSSDHLGTESGMSVFMVKLLVFFSLSLSLTCVSVCMSLSAIGLISIHLHLTHLPWVHQDFWILQPIYQSILFQTVLLLSHPNVSLMWSVQNGNFDIRISVVSGIYTSALGFRNGGNHGGPKIKWLQAPEHDLTQKNE